MDVLGKKITFPPGTDNHFIKIDIFCLKSSFFLIISFFFSTLKLYSVVRNKIGGSLMSTEVTDIKCGFKSFQ